MRGHSLAWAGGVGVMSALGSILALIGNRPVFTVEVEDLSNAPRVTRVVGHEGLSRLYEFRVELACGPEVELADLTGKTVALCIEGIDEARHVHGMVGEVDYVGESRNYGLFEVTLVPKIWRLQHRHDCRIFQHKTTEEVVRQVLKAAGVSAKAYRFDLHGSYTPRNYCVQYRESDLAFVSRLLEEDGIFYFFQHSAESHVMVMADHISAHPPIPGVESVWWNPPGGLVHDREHILDFRFGERVRPGTATLRDFHFPTPVADMQAREQAAENRDLEVYDYPGEYREVAGASLDRGQALARVRLQELQRSRRVGAGKSDCMRLVPGHTFRLAGHGRNELNLEFLLTSVVHRGYQPQVLGEDATGVFDYKAEFVCMERSAPYRPPRETPRPVMRGLQSATVVGPAGEEVHTDEQGRVMVQFHWDRQGQHDEQSSCWVRVSQLWAGAGWGAMFLPRIGHEVLVDFLEGDPDRPIITGRAYHGLNDLPYALPAEKTKSTIKSDSSRGGGGYNELRFEDRKGEEQVFIRAENDLDIFVQHDRMEDVHHDRHLRVGQTTPQGKVGDYNQLVLRDKHTRVERDTHTHIGGSVLLRIGGLDGDGNQHVVIEGSRLEQIKGDQHHHVEGGARTKIDGSRSLTVDGATHLKAGSTYALAAGQEVHIMAPKIVLEASEGITFKGPGGFITIDSGGVVIQGQMVRINSGGAALSGSGADPQLPEDPLIAQPVTPRGADHGLEA